MATSSPFPKPYRMRKQPSLGDGWNAYLLKELRDLQDTLDGVLVMLPQAATEAPTIPVEGMVRVAKSPWRPVSGQTADRMVVYVDGAWTYAA